MDSAACCTGFEGESLFSSFNTLFCVFLQESTVQSTVHQPPLKIQIRIDCVEPRMESHVVEEEGTIIRLHRRTLTLRYCANILSASSKFHRGINSNRSIKCKA